ncbi:MAG TPA: 50S ribosomal protein L22 [Candidatus Eisenbacteria bacterium]|jgi:large subunit ribosomal protein L22|nr:50S ribosomal protein L22 [Candidatus Eisenbacteria bacterium]
MEVIAHARHIRISPKKVRLVVDLVRGMDVDRASAQLRFYRKAAARPVSKLLDSAIANAEHNFKLNAGNLYIKKATVDGGPVLKRWRARAFGRAAGIKKRSSHITIVLAERSTGTAKGIEAAVVKKAEAPKKAPAKTEKKPASKSKSKNA